MENSQYLKGGVRDLTKAEHKLMLCLLKESQISLNIDINSLKVMEMNDGGMGSLYFVSDKKLRNERLFGGTIAEKVFYDTDGVMLSITLNVDKEGILYELDIWKVDFSPLNEIPNC